MILSDLVSFYAMAINVPSVVHFNCLVCKRTSPRVNEVIRGDGAVAFNTIPSKKVVEDVMSFCLAIFCSNVVHVSALHSDVMIACQKFELALGLHRKLRSASVWISHVQDSGTTLLDIKMFEALFDNRFHSFCNSIKQ